MHSNVSHSTVPDHRMEDPVLHLCRPTITPHILNSIFLKYHIPSVYRDQVEMCPEKHWISTRRRGNFGRGMCPQ